MVATHPSGRGGRSVSTRLDLAPPVLELRHSAAVVVLARMGFQGDATAATFNDYIKSLRRLGLPFVLGVTRPGAWLAMYEYEHLMELALALSLRCYNILPDPVVTHLIEVRPVLNRLYGEAWHLCAKASPRPLVFRSRDGSAHVARGPYLDLQMRQTGRSLGWQGLPRLISAREAMELYGSTGAPVFVPGPIRISALVHRLASALATPL